MHLSSFFCGRYVYYSPLTASARAITTVSTMIPVPKIDYPSRGIFCEMGIYLTPVATTCSVFGRGRLSAEPAGVGDTLFDRGGMPGIPVSTSLARGLSLPALRRAKELAEA